MTHAATAAPTSHPASESLTVEHWLAALPTEDHIASISAVRRYFFDESAYDKQYSTDPGNLRVGRGLIEVLREMHADFSGPAIEIGCGTGLLTLGLACDLPYPLFLVTDPSPEFLKITRTKIDRHKIDTARLRFGVLMGEELDRLPHGEWSLVTLRSALHHVLDWQKFIEHSASLLKPGGVLAMQEPCLEGYLLMGTIMHSFPAVLRAAGHTPTDEHLKHITLFCDTMKFYCRRDVDKSQAEDKHLFRVDEIMRVGDRCGLAFEFRPNVAFEHHNPLRKSIKGPDSFAWFVRMYAESCMLWPADLLELFDKHLAPTLQYVEESATGSAGPYMHGLLLGVKR